MAPVLLSLAGERLDGAWITRAPDGRAIGNGWFFSRRPPEPGVKAYPAFAPQPPPQDLDPPTADFRELQVWLDELGFGEAAAWLGDGAGVRIADIEYAWDEAHEDLGATIGARAWGVPWDFVFHGNGVLGILVAGVDGYGVDGAAPGAEPLVVHPFADEATYTIAGAVAAAAELLVPGDVLLIEQQISANGVYCPVSYEEATWDAIRAAADAGIVVVEPAGNGAADLDAPEWEGAFHRDSGSILVGAGEDASWTGTSGFGQRIDAVGWNTDIVTASSDDYGSAYTDLFYPDGDGRQAYTSNFGGTSGASAQVAAVAAVVQSVALARDGEPWHPDELRAALTSTGNPGDGEVPLGSQPDVRRLLRTYFLR